MDQTRRQTALITGASQGFGRALARAMAFKGWNLIIDARGAEALRAVEVELAVKTEVIAIAGDVTDVEHRQELVQAAKKLAGVDVLINNASALGPSPLPRLLEYPLEGLMSVYRTNVLAPLAMIQALGEQLGESARIVNISSDAAIEGYEGWGGYGSSKAALDQLSRVLAAEHPQWKVYSVDPGDMRTAMHQAAFPGEDISDRPLAEESVPGLLPLIDGAFPSGRYKAEEIAHERLSAVS